MKVRAGAGKGTQVFTDLPDRITSTTTVCLRPEAADGTLEEGGEDITSK